MLSFRDGNDQAANAASSRFLPIPLCLAIGWGSILVFACSLGCKPKQDSPAKQETASRNSTDSVDQTPSQLAEASIERGLKYLFAQQHADGGWHSDYYGALKPGGAITANVLYGISTIPASHLEPYREQLLQAKHFFEPSIDEHGYAAAPNASPNYANYASAMLLLADQRLDLQLTDAQKSKLVQFLINSRIDETQGYEAGDIDFGGWDLMGWEQSPRESAGTNISVSRVATQALVLHQASHPQVTTILEDVDRWSIGCQNVESDGGFFFHPLPEHNGNKAGWSDEAKEQPISYGSTTADGLQLLIALGHSMSDPRVEQASNWLRQHGELEQVPGLADAPSPDWDQGLLYYYYHALAPLVPHLQSAEATDSLQEWNVTNLHKRLVHALVDRQSKEGSWSNASNRMREDDPLISTPLALHTLGSLLTNEQDKNK